MWVGIFTLRARSGDLLMVVVCIVMSAVFAVIAAGLGAVVIGQRRSLRDSQRFIDQLMQFDAGDVSPESLRESLPPLGKKNAMRPSLDRLRERVGEFLIRIEDAEHSRTTADVRVRRVTSEREQMSEILAGIPDPVLAIDHFDEVVLANSSAKKLFALEDKPEKRAVDQLVQCQTLIDLLTDTRRRKTPVQRTTEVELPDDSGQRRSYRITCRSLAAKPDGEGDPSGPPAPSVVSGAVAVLNDISSLKAIQKRNAEFVSSVSHEMKTPLSSIKAYTELLADGDAETEEQREEFLDVITTQTDRLQRLINNLLNLARIEAGVVDVNKKPQSLNAVLEEAASVVAPSAEQKKLDFKSDLSPMYLGVLIDRDMLSQAAINLLSNAIKYTKEGGRVTLRSRLEDREVAFEVEDSGVGLSPEDCEKVFEKFYRVKKDQQMAPGTGLGLPLAKHIVEDVHGGRLTVKSELGKGSTFIVTLPLGKG